MFSKDRAHRAWLATIVEELAAPLREMSSEEIASRYLDEVDSFDFTRDGVWIQVEVQAWLENRRAGPGSPMIVTVAVSGDGCTNTEPVTTMFLGRPAGGDDNKGMTRPRRLGGWRLAVHAPAVAAPRAAIPHQLRSPRIPNDVRPATSTRDRNTLNAAESGERALWRQTKQRRAGLKVEWMTGPTSPGARSGAPASGRTGPPTSPGRAGEVAPPRGR